MVAQMCKSGPNVRLFKIATNPLEENQPESSVQYIDRDVDYRSEIRHFSPLGVDLVLDCQVSNCSIANQKVLTFLKSRDLFSVRGQLQ